MGEKTGIAWTEATWNPLAGCSRVSEGCRHCYAERMAWRLVNMAPDRVSSPYFGLVSMGQESNFKEPRWSGEVRLVESALDRPLRWRTPRRIFVNSMSDLFHEKAPDEWIDRIFAVMALAPQHHFQVLTKRPERMLAYLTAPLVDRKVWWAGRPMAQARGWDMYDRVPVPSPCGGPGGIGIKSWPLPNVWLGVSVEDQATADARIPLLLQTPAAVRWVSYEPALGPVNLGLGRWVRLPRTVRSDIPFKDLWAVPGVYMAESNPHGALSVRSTGGTLIGIKPDEFERLPSLDWIVVGGESGPGARPFDLAWARSAIAQCRAAGVPCFVKQLGSRPCGRWGYVPYPAGAYGIGDFHVLRNRKGADPSEWPADLRVREYPSDGPR